MPMCDCMVSVIMPVYNAQDTIKRSVLSVVKQKISEIELICVDDGSTDNTIEVLKGLGSEIPFIRILQQNRCGAGLARNSGIKSARGKYVAFLDADDEYIDENALAMMVDACEKKGAFICGSYRTVMENEIEKPVGLFDSFNIPPDGCCVKYVDFQHDYDYQSFIFKRDFLLNNGIEFPPYMRYQDPPFFIKAMAEAKKFYVLPIIFYRYYFEGQKRNVIIRYMNDILRGILDSLQMAVQYGYTELFEKVRRRLDEEYRESILCGLSDDVMHLLLKINDYSVQYDGKRIELMDFIYDSVRNKSNLGKSHYYLERLLEIKQSGIGVGQYLSSQGIFSVAIFGLGKFGRILANELLADNVKIVCAIDKKISEYKNIRIVREVDNILPCDAVIVSLLEPEEVIFEIKAKCECRILSFVEIIRSVWLKTTDESENSVIYERQKES